MTDPTPHPARAIADEWIRQGRASSAATAHALAVTDAGPMVAPCDPTPRPPTCGVTSAPVPRDPPGMSHRVPLAPVEPVTVAHVLDALAICRAAVEHMGRRGVSREHGPAPIAALLLPPIPELVPGADAAARRETIDRVAPLLRAAAELAALLETAPPDVATRARRALALALDDSATKKLRIA